MYAKDAPSRGSAPLRFTHGQIGNRPDLGLVVETDGLRYHRTPAEQARDRLTESPPGRP